MPRLFELCVPWFHVFAFCFWFSKRVAYSALSRTRPLLKALKIRVWEMLKKLTKYFLKNEMLAVCLVFTTFASHFFFIILCSLISNLLLCLDLLFFLPLALRAASACDYFFSPFSQCVYACVCGCNIALCWPNSWQTAHLEGKIK